jgi:hypothetical protein
MSILKTVMYRLFPMLHVINQPKPQTIVQKYEAHINELTETIERRSSGLAFVGKDRRQQHSIEQLVEKQRKAA